MRHLQVVLLVVTSLAAMASGGCSGSRVPLLSYGKPDVALSAFAAPPAITPVGGGTYALQLPPLAGSTPVSVLPRLKVRKDTATITGHMTFEPQTGPFQITLRGSKAAPGAVTFVWEDPDGTRHPLQVAGVEAAPDGGAPEESPPASDAPRLEALPPALPPAGER